MSQAPVIVVSDVLPGAQSTNGFSGRLLGFLSAIGERAPVIFAHITGDVHSSAMPLLKLEFRHVPIRGGSWLGDQPEAPVRKLHHHTIDRLPALCPHRRLRDLRALVQDVRPQSVVLYLPYLANLAAAIPLRVPIVFALEEGWERLFPYDRNDVPPLRRLLHARERRRIERLYTRVRRRHAVCTAISELERGYFCDRYGMESPVVVPHAVDTAFFSPQSAEPRFDVAVFGDLTRERNRRPALAAQAAALRAGRVWRWGFIGVGQPSESGSTCTWTGYVNDIRPYYAASRVVLVPADAGTGVKTTLLQAWAMGRPVVASEHATIGLPVVHGKNALVARSPGEAVFFCGELLEDAALASAMAAAGRREATKSRDVRVVSDMFATVVAAATSSARPGHRHVVSPPMPYGRDPYV